MIEMEAEKAIEIPQPETCPECGGPTKYVEGNHHGGSMEQLREELVQTAAMAVRALLNLHRAKRRKRA